MSRYNKYFLGISQNFILFFPFRANDLHHNSSCMDNFTRSSRAEISFTETCCENSRDTKPIANGLWWSWYHCRIVRKVVKIYYLQIRLNWQGRKCISNYFITWYNNNWFNWIKMYVLYNRQALLETEQLICFVNLNGKFNVPISAHQADLITRTDVSVSHNQSF